MRVAILANHLFVKPAIAFCSCKIIGTPQSFAAIPPGPETYPPIPSTASGFSS